MTKINILLFLLFFLLNNNLSTKAQDYEWAINIGNGQNNGCNSVAVDDAGNVYVTGTFRGVVDFDPGPDTVNLVTTTAEGNAFLAKYDAAGNYIWAKSVEGGGSVGMSLTLDTWGNLYLLGHFSSMSDFDLTQSTNAILNSAGSFDVFLAKYDTGGNYSWAFNIGSRFLEFANKVRVDGLGNVYIAGLFGAFFLPDSVDFDPGPGVANLIATSQFGFETFVAKYDSTGKYRWAINIGSTGAIDEPAGIAVDSTGNIYVTSHFMGTADFDPGPNVVNLSPTNGTYDTDIFLAKYDSAGRYVWAKSIGGEYEDYSYNVALDDKNNRLYIVGWSVSPTTDFDPGSGTAVIPVGGGFVAQYDTAGTCMWVKAARGWGSTRAVDVDRVGNVYVTGYFYPNYVIFSPDDPEADTLNGGISIVKYDTTGKYLWGGSVALDAGSDRSFDIAMHKSGSVHVVGHFGGTRDFDPGPDTVLQESPVDPGLNWALNGFILKLSCRDTSSYYIAESILCGEVYNLNDEVYDTSGIYKQVFSNALGCDSTVVFELTVLPIEQPVINVDSFKLGVNGNYATYQWLKNGEIIPEATDSVYHVTENADYQVIVTNEAGCSDTSDVYSVDNYTNINAISALARQISIYPNPSNSKIYIQTPLPVNVKLTDITGRLILKKYNEHIISLQGLADGIYLLHIISAEDRLIKVEKVIKE